MVDSCRRHLERLAREIAVADLSKDVVDIFETQLELVYRDIVCLELLGDIDNVATVHLVGEEVRKLVPESETSAYEAEIQSDSENIGRPRYNIDRGQLDFLLQTKFTVPQIALLLNVFVRTIRRRMDEYELSVRQLYSPISNHDLDAIVRHTQINLGFLATDKC